MPLYRTPLVSKDQPLVFTAGPNAGCATPYFQQTLLNVSKAADSGAAADGGYGPRITAIEGDISDLNGEITTLTNGKVNKAPFTNTWAAATGTAERTTFATYTAPTISASPTQAEVQAIANATQILSRRLKALIDDLKS